MTMEMDASLKLRIASCGILFAASLVGILLPLYLSKWGRSYEQYYPYLQTGAAGIMFGLSMIHLSPEATEVLNEIYPDYPIGFVLIAFGVFLVLYIEQVVLILFAKSAATPFSKGEALNPKEVQMQKIDRDVEAGHNKDDEHDEDCGFVSCAHTKHQFMREDNIDDHNHNHNHQETTESSHVHNHGHHGPCSSSCSSDSSKKQRSSDRNMQHDHDHDHGHSHVHNINPYHNHKSECSEHLDHAHIPCEHELMALADLAKAETLQDLILAYALELSTATHSIIIGVNLGLLGSNEYSTISVLLVALCFHQFIEGMGIGNVIDSNRKSLGRNKIIIFVLIFSLTVSLGVMIGILTSSQDPTDSEEVAKGAATAIASGCLLYTSLVEMVGKYFGHTKELESSSKSRIGMLISFSLGFAFMAIIGIWA